MSIKIYRAVDAADGEDSLFAVKEDTKYVAVSTYGCDHPMLTDDYDEMLTWGYSKPGRFNDAINPVLVRTVN